MFDPFQNPCRLTIPGFQKQEQYVGQPIVFPPDGLSTNEWFQRFRQRFQIALNNHENLPIFRASHGEYLFALGRPDRPGRGRSRIRHYLSRIKWSMRFLSTFYSGTPGYGYETYRQWLLPGLRQQFAEHLRWISSHGVICTYFADRDACSLDYQKAFWSWLNMQNIELTPTSYSHVYFVYALFHGPQLRDILGGKRLIIVASELESRRTALERNLTALGVQEVRYIPISRSHSMLDRVTPPTKFKADLCLIGAGVGASNILYQLRTLECPCVDAGFVLDTLAWPEMRKRRIYCVGDDLWESYYPDNKAGWAKQFDDTQSEIPDACRR